jgi:hypothetical protein
MYLFMIKKNIQGTKGFAMLFTVLIVSLILSIALGISNITFKQTILSGLAKDSQIALYQADTGVECGMYYDTLLPALFPIGTDPAKAPDMFYCGNTPMVRDDAQSYTDYIVYRPKVDGRVPCTMIIFDKTKENKVQSRGYNICDSHPRQVERALEVTY